MKTSSHVLKIFLQDNKTKIWQKRFFLQRTLRSTFTVIIFLLKWYCRYDRSLCVCTWTHIYLSTFIFLILWYVLTSSLFLPTSFYISLRRIDWQDTLKEMRSDPLRLACSAHTLRIIMTPPAGQDFSVWIMFACMCGGYICVGLCLRITLLPGMCRYVTLTFFLSGISPPDRRGQAMSSDWR